jgi:hypothetical protein
MLCNPLIAGGKVEVTVNSQQNEMGTVGSESGLFQTQQPPPSTRELHGVAGEPQTGCSSE